MKTAVGKCWPWPHVSFSGEAALINQKHITNINLNTLTEFSERVSQTVSHPVRQTLWAQPDAHSV
jgi:hypothetical protein